MLLTGITFLRLYLLRSPNMNYKLEIRNKNLGIINSKIELRHSQIRNYNLDFTQKITYEELFSTN